MEDRIDRIAKSVCGWQEDDRLSEDLLSSFSRISVSPYYSSFKKYDSDSCSVEWELRSVCINSSGAFLPEVFIRKYRDGKMTAGYEFVDCVGIELEYPWWHDYECYPQDSIVGIREELATISEELSEMFVEERNRAMELHSMANEEDTEGSGLSEDTISEEEENP